MNFVFNNFGSRLYKRSYSLDSSLSDLPSFELLPSAKLIGEGNYRKVYLEDDTIIKILKPYRKKKEGLVTISYPISVYTAYKFGFSDFNQHELKNYQRLQENLPVDLRKNFQHIRYVGFVNGESASICDAIRDYDGNLSKNCVKTSHTLDSTFFDSLDYVFEYLSQSRTHFMDYRPANVLAQKQKDDSVIPVFFDYKRIGHTTYPFLPWLRFNHFSEQRSKRRFERMKNELHTRNDK